MRKKRDPTKIIMLLALALFATGAGYNNGKLVATVEHQELSIRAEVDLVRVMDRTLKNNAALKATVVGLLETIDNLRAELDSPPDPVTAAPGPTGHNGGGNGHDEATEPDDEPGPAEEPDEDGGRHDNDRGKGHGGQGKGHRK